MNQSWTLLFSLLCASLVGCEQKTGDDIEAANKAGRAILVKWKGNAYKFPAAIEFDGQTWIRSREKRESITGVVDWYYLGSDPNVRVQYSQWPSKHDLKETFTTYCRTDPQSRWKQDGKERLVDSSGAWFESTYDQNRGIRKNGPYEYAYENGVLKYSGHERDDVSVGPAEAYYPDGTLWWKGEYINSGLPDYHSWRFWGPDGEELKNLRYDEKLEQYNRWFHLHVPAEASPAS